MNVNGVPTNIVGKHIRVFIGNFSFDGDCIEFDTENGLIHLKELDENILLLNVESADALTIEQEQSK